MRIEWVKVRLNNWALWKAREAGGGLGFASTSSFLREVDSSRYRESIIPIDECDASVTNDGVESLKPGRAHLYACLQAIYIKDAGIKGAAHRLGKAESTIKAQLEQADQALATWFIERQQRQAEKIKLMRTQK